MHHLRNPTQSGTGPMAHPGGTEFTEVADLIAHATTPNPPPGDPAFRVDTGANLTRAFTVLNNGHVGIGTATPAVPLEIATGRMRFSSNFGDIEFTEIADL